MVRANLHAGRRTLCGDRAFRIALAVGAVRICTLAESDRSRCGAMRLCTLADEPSAGIARVGSLSLWRHATLHAGRRTLCGDRACRIALAVGIVSDRSRCGAVPICTLADAPSAGIVRVGSLSLWRRANLHAGRRTLCGDRACRVALAVAPCDFARWPTNPLRGSRVSDRSRCGAVRSCTLADEPSAGIVRVGSLSLWRRANLHAGRRTLCGDRACRIALAVGIMSDRSRCGAVRICTLADEPSAGIVRVGSLSLWRRACRVALAVAPCEFARADEPSAGIVRVGSLWLRRRAKLHAGRRTLCGGRACRIVRAVVFVNIQ